MYLRLLLAILLVGLGPSSPTQAQIYEDPQFEGYYFIVDNGDTFDVVVYPEVIVLSEGQLTQAEIDYWRRLRYNVYKVYNYSIIASKILLQVDNDLANVSSKKERRKYLRSQEDHYSKLYKKELKNLTKSQGQILVKLINRNTGKDAYSIIKELRGGVTARVSQTAAYFFDNDLKAFYDPTGADKDLEMIVQEIEDVSKRVQQ